MRLISRSTLVALVAGLLLLFLLGAGCSDSYRMIDEEVRENDASIRIKDFRRESILTDGTRQWYVKADEAFIYQEGNQPSRIIAYQFHFEQYDAKGNITNRIEAERGEIDQDDEMFYLSGDVVFVNGEKNRTVRAEEVEYDRIEEVLTSEKSLVIEEAGLTTRCTRGAEVDNFNNRQVCRGPVVLSVSETGRSQDPGDIFQ